MGIIARPLGMLLTLIYDFVGSYGLAIVIFTVIVKLCLYPLYAKQIKSSVRMAEVQPKMAALQQKYRNDKEKLNEKMMELYKEEKYNPMSGCLPMLIQLPIIFGLFSLLRNPMTYIAGGDEMLLTVHESFLWIMDLSQPDLWVLPILAGVSTFISFTQTQSQQAAMQQPGAANTQSMMKVMKYIFPLMIIYMGRSFPAGLTIYWFVNTLVQILFNIHLNRVRKKMRAEAEKRKNKK